MMKFRTRSILQVSIYLLLFFISLSCSQKSDLNRKTIYGKWERSDGGYNLVISPGESPNQVKVLYFNPQPIHVAAATLTQENGQSVLHVKLEDFGYPGSIYRLCHDPEQDTLFGTYYQATENATYEVTFLRVATSTLSH